MSTIFVPGMRLVFAFACSNVTLVVRPRILRVFVSRSCHSTASLFDQHITTGILP